MIDENSQTVAGAVMGTALGVIAGAAIIAGALHFSGCYAPRERERAAWDAYTRATTAAKAPARGPAGPAPDFSGGPGAYIAYALAHAPELAAARDRWAAKLHGIGPTRRLPAPELGYAVDLRNVSGNGPERQTVSVMQEIPWLTRLIQSAAAATAEADAQEMRHQAAALALTRRVSEAYWRLWLLRRTREIHGQHLEVLKTLSASARARVATGTTTLADQQQIDLSAARVEDRMRALAQAAAGAEARLRGAVNAPQNLHLPTEAAPPEATVPALAPAELREAAARHPRSEAMARMGAAGEAMAQAEEAMGLPGFTFGLDWNIMNDSAMAPGANTNDEVMVGVTMMVPLWRSSYEEAANAARAGAAAQRSEAQVERNRMVAAAEAALASVRDSARRMVLYRTTLIPQAEAALTSVLGGYMTGLAPVPAALMAQRDLLDLRIEQQRALAEHAMAWAMLREAVGGEVPAQKYDETQKENQP